MAFLDKCAEGFLSFNRVDKNEALMLLGTSLV